MAQQGQQDRADHRPDQGRQAAQDDHHQDLARGRPVQQLRGDELGVLGGQHPGQPGDRAGQGEGAGLVGPHRQAQGAHPLLVAVDPGQGLAVGRRQEPGQRDVDQDRHQDRGDREAPRLEEFDAEGGEVQTRDPGQAVVAAQGPGLEDELVAHLAEGQGDHDEEDPAHPGHDGADHQGQDPGRKRRDHERQARRPAQDHGQRREAVGAEPEEGGVAQRHQPGHPGQQVQAHRQDREDRDLGQQLQAEVLGPRGVGEQTRKDQRGEPVAEGESFHHAVTPAPETAPRASREGPRPAAGGSGSRRRPGPAPGRR